MFPSYPSMFHLSLCVSYTCLYCLFSVLLSLSFQDINKRLSLPADIRLPDGYLEKFNVIGPSLFEQPISRRLHRVSLVCLPVSVRFNSITRCNCSFVILYVYVQSEIGFGKLETYIKLDKLGEVKMDL